MAKKKKWSSVKANKAARRRAHFDQGGTLATWRGRAKCLDPNKRAIRSKSRCRGSVNWD